MTHLEDKVIYGGVNGTRQAIMALRGMRDMLGGKHKGNVSVKWDGAPAIFCGQDPSDGVFFVAKKGVFNKNPKVYKSNADVDADIAAGDLNDKMKAALKYLPSLGIKGVIQGDFLFGPGDLKKKTIEGKEYVVFHPNTIVYAVPVEQAKELLSAKIGIVWHTTYKGSSFETMGASYGVDVKKLKKSTAVWSQNALRDVSNATMSEKDTEEVNKYFSKAFREIYQYFGFNTDQSAWYFYRKFLIDGYLSFEIIYDETQKQIIAAQNAYKNMHTSIADINREFSLGRMSNEERVEQIKRQSEAFQDVISVIDMTKVSSEGLKEVLEKMSKEGESFGKLMEQSKIQSEKLDSVFSSFSGIPALGEVNTLLKTNIKDTVAFKAAVFALGAALGVAAMEYFGAPMKAALQAEKERHQNEIDTIADVAKLKKDFF